MVFGVVSKGASMEKRGTKIVVIGAGLGGMSAAISLAATGYSVEVFEKNEKVGGKLNLHQTDGFSFDLGPSILTLPHIFEALFARAGKKFAAMVPLRALDPQWRNFFEDGTTFDLFFDQHQPGDRSRSGSDRAAIALPGAFRKIVDG